MGLRDRLRARQLPTVTVVLAGDRSAYAAAERELDSANRALLDEQARGSYDLAAERARVEVAQSALDELPVEKVVLRALPPSDWEALVEAHPPPKDRVAELAWNPSTFRAALLSASVVLPDGEEPPDWEELTRGGHLTAGELNALFEAAVSINARAPQVSTGKD
jgi:hypothetical protein